MQIPDIEELPIIQEIHAEKDRGAAVIAAGLLEAKLSDLLSATLRDDKDTARQLLKPTGPLGGFGNKALLGYMLRLYRKHTRDDLVCIGEIRNRFAHRPEIITFETEFVRTRCEKLTTYERVWSVIPDYKFPAKPYDQKSARHVYLQTISLLSNFFRHQSLNKEYRDEAEKLLPI